MNKVIIKLLTICIFLSVSCKEVTNPTIELTSKTLTNEINNYTNNLIELENMEKTDGVASELGGVKFYRIYFKGSVKYKKDCVAGKFSFPDYDGKASFLDIREDNYNENKFNYIDNGTNLKITGDIFYEQFESGWKATKIYLSPKVN